MTTNVPESVRVHRLPERASYDRDTIHQILDASLVCHLSTVDEDGRPLVVPMQHARIGDAVYLHGSTGSRHMRRAAQGADVCLAVTVLDGIVLAHRLFNHSVNYRSVVLRGKAEPVEDPAEKLEALRAFTERLLPGRWAEADDPNDKELKATLVLRLPITEASAKQRSGWPGHVEDEDDLSRLWVGVIPIAEVAGAPLAHPDLPESVAVSPSVAQFYASHSSRPEET